MRGQKALILKDPLGQISLHEKQSEWAVCEFSISFLVCRMFFSFPLARPFLLPFLSLSHGSGK